MRTLHVAVVPLKLRLGRVETVRGSAAYAVTQLNRKRSRTVNVASFFIDDTPFMVANNEERPEHEIALLHRSYIITMQEGKTGHEKRKIFILSKCPI